MLPTLCLVALGLYYTVVASPVPVQLQFSSPSSIPPLNRHSFLHRHTLLDLNDGHWIPSPAFGSGSAFFGQNNTLNVLQALEQGYRHLDNSPVYGNEKSVGDAIRASGIKRDELYITTKYDHLNGSSVEKEFQASLHKLGVAYIDLLMIHFPRAAEHCPLDVWRSFESLVHRGLVRSIGVSNYGLTNLAALYDVPGGLVVPPAVNQVSFHAYDQLTLHAALAFGKDKGIRTAAYSSLTPLTKQPGGKADTVVQKIANKRGWTASQVLLAWVKAKEVAVVTTSGNAEHQRQQLDVFGPHFPHLSKEEVHAIDKAGEKQERHNSESVQKISEECDSNAQ